MEIFPAEMLHFCSAKVVEPFARASEESTEVGGPAIIQPGGWWKFSCSWEHQTWDNAARLLDLFNLLGKRTFGLPLWTWRHLPNVESAMLADGSPVLVSHDRVRGFSEFAYTPTGDEGSNAAIQRLGTGLYGTYVSVDGWAYRPGWRPAYIGEDSQGRHLFRFRLYPNLHLDSFVDGDYALETKHPVAWVQVEGEVPSLRFESRVAVPLISMELKEVGRGS